MRIKRPLMLFCILVVIICIVKNVLYEKASLHGELPKEAVTLQGRLDWWETGNGQTILYLSDIYFYGDSAKEITNYNSTGIRCYVEESKNLKLGQSVAVQGFLALPESADNPGGFDAAAYYRSRGYKFVLYQGEILERGESYDVILQGLYNLHQYAGRQLKTYLTPENAGIMSAMLLGDKSNMTAETKELYRTVGIYHILAISGLHISMLGGCVYKLLKRSGIKKGMAVMFCLLLIVLYGIMIGMPPSAFRAIVMFGFGVVAPLFYRSHDKLTSMAATAACLAVWEPQLMFDAGVQLSFLAVLGIVVLYPTFLGIHKHHMKVADGVWISFAVTYMTFPVVMLTYYEVPLYSLLVNVCVLPFVPLLLGLGLFVIAAGGLWPFAAEAAGGVIHMILLFYEKLLTFVAELPGNSYVTGAPEMIRVWIFYGVLGGMIWLILKLKRKLLIRSLISENKYFQGRQKEYAMDQIRIKRIMMRVRLMQTIIMTGLVIMCLMPKYYDCKITFLDVGQGDGICIESGRNVYLLDCGSTSENMLGIYTILPFLKYEGITEVEGWFLTHPDEDHTSAFVELCNREDMGGIDVKALYIPGVLEKEFAEIIALAEQKEIEVVMLTAGDILYTDMLKWTVLSPGKDTFYHDENEASLVLYLECDAFDCLLMGDAGITAEQAVTDSGICDVAVLKVGHHGSAIDANSEDFIHVINPEVSVISCGENNRYGHPHRDTVERLNSVESLIWLTHEKGALTVEIEDKIRLKSY